MIPTTPIEAEDYGESTPLLNPTGPRDKHGWFIYLAAATSAVGGFLFGYDTGIISGAMIYIRDVFSLNEWWQEAIVSSTLLGAWIFSILSGLATDKFGRKPVIIASSVIFVTGSLVMALANNEIALLIGRLIVGAGVGFASMTVPMYIAEIAPPSIRGQLVMLNMCSITGGQFIATLIAYWFSTLSRSKGWRYMLAFAAVPAAIQFIVFLFMPESPRWLTRHYREAEAKQVLRKIRPVGSDIDREFEAIKKNCCQAREEANREKEESTDGTELTTFQRILATQPVRKALLVGCILQLVQQFSGINTVMYYSASIFEMSGVHSKREALLLSSGTAAINFVFTLVGFVLVERAGRRVLTLSSLLGVSISLLIIAAGFQFAYVKSPQVTSVDYSALNQPCDTLESCSSCTRNPLCGFCFLEDPSKAGSVLNASCLHVDRQHHDRALLGDCSFNQSLRYQSSFSQRSLGTNSFIWAYEWCPSAYSWLTLLGVGVYLLSFAFGMGPMPWTINSEIYPSWARSWCQSASTSVNWLSNLVVSMTFLSLTRAITKHGAFYVYAVFAILGLLYFVIVLPETRGKSLEELEDLFASDTWRKSVSKRNSRRANKDPHQTPAGSK